MTNKKLIAEKLLFSEAVKLNIETPFTFASGWKSPIYCDNRVLLSIPNIRDLIKSEFCALIFEKFEHTEVIAGVASAGVPWGTMAADQLKYPFVYVRPKPKEHGMGNLIEGRINAGAKVLVVEDLVSTGKSSFQAINALLEKKVEIIGLISIFDYGFDVSKALFENAKIPFYSLTDYPTLIDIAIQKGIVSENVKNTLEEWRINPATWKIN